MDKDRINNENKIKDNNIEIIEDEESVRLFIASVVMAIELVREPNIIFVIARPIFTMIPIIDVLKIFFSLFSFLFELISSS